MTTDDSHEGRIRNLEIAITDVRAKLNTIAEVQKQQLESQRWLNRVVVGAVALAIVGFVVKGGLVDGF